MQAAAAAVARGVNVALVDVGETQDPTLPAGAGRELFQSLRKTDPNQSKYLLGDPATALANLARAGAHLTPPRQYMIRKMAELFATAIGHVSAVAGDQRGRAWACRGGRTSTR